MEQFPLVALVAPCTWEGFVNVPGPNSQEQFQICVICAAAGHGGTPSARVGPVLAGRFYANARCAALLADHSSSLERMWRNASAAAGASPSADGGNLSAAFLRDIVDLLEKLLSLPAASLLSSSSTSQALASAKIASDGPLPSAQYYKRLLAELEQIGWGNVHLIDSTMSRISLRLSDQARRVHEVSLELSSEYPSRAPIARLQAPCEIDLSVGWTAATSTLGSAVSKIRQAFEDLSPFWDVCDDIDAHCAVLEPDPPNRMACHRRIALGHHCSLLINLNSRQPMQRCDIRFSGAEANISPLEDAWSRGQLAWDSSIQARENLQRILNVKFPSKSDATLDENMAIECGICYSFLLDKAVPEIVCESAACARCFHSSCLVHWLHALPTTRHSYQTLFGHCPYCTTAISVTASAASHAGGY